MVPWQAQKAKVQLRLATQRLRILQEKKLALAKQSRRDIADLVTKNRVETARLRVETLIGDDIHVELLEIIELYTETLLARFALLDASKETPDPSLMDAVCALIYAAPHTELKELHMAREMLMQKFGRPFAVSVVNNDPPCVPARVLNKMAIYIPPPELVDAYLQEIARGYGITWTSDRLEAKAEEDRRADLEREVKAADDKAESNKNGGVTTKTSDTSGNTQELGEKSESSFDKVSPEAKKLMDDIQKNLGKEDKQENDLAALAARFDALKKR